MNLTSTPTDAIQDALRSNTGVVEFVDNLLCACARDGVHLRWETDGCHVWHRGNPKAKIETLQTKSQFRAVLARIAALCNEQKKSNSVSPYGGQAMLPVAADQEASLSIAFVNTPDTQFLEIHLVRQNFRKRLRDKMEELDRVLDQTEESINDPATHLAKPNGI